jgi:hypothetical protein
LLRVLLFRGHAVPAEAGLLLIALSWMTQKVERHLAETAATDENRYDLVRVRRRPLGAWGDARVFIDRLSVG